MRVLLVLPLSLGLAPGLEEVLETVVHLASTGHLAHSSAVQGGLGDRGDEHGCGATQHRCGCCASQSVVPIPRVEVLASGARSPGHPTSVSALASLAEPAPPSRPPIAT